MDAMTIAQERVSAEAERFTRLLNERTEALLETLQVGESLAVRTITAHDSIPVRVLFQIVMPGMAPERGFEWTVYGPKV